MADRLDDIVIGLRVEDEATTALKKAQQMVSKFSTTATTDIKSSQQTFANLQEAIKSISKYIDTSDAKISNYYRTMQNGLTSAIGANNRYNAILEKQQQIMAKIAAKNGELAAINTAGAKGGGLPSYLSKFTAKGDFEGAGEALSNRGLKRQSTIQNYSELIAKAQSYYSQIDTLKKQYANTEAQAERATLAYNKAVNTATNSTSNLVNAQLKSAESAQQQAAELENTSVALNEVNIAQNETDEGTNKIADGLDKINKKLKSLKFTNLLSMLYLIRRVINLMKKFIEESASWTENLNLLEVVFGETNEEAKDFVNMAAKNFGLNTNDIARYVSVFKQMANAMGQADDVGTKMSETLTLLSLDVASLRNVSFDTVVSDFASAIAGQVKPVRKYGFDITAQSIDALLKESGIGGSSSMLSMREKQLARTILIIRQGRDAYGDLGKTINTFANQQRILNDQIKVTLRLIGNLLLGEFKAEDSYEQAKESAGIATRAIWMLNGALMALNQVLEVIAPTANEFNTGGISDGADDAANAIDEMDESMQRSLASFDKFNALQSSDGSSGAFGSLEELFNQENDKYMTDWNEKLKSINMYSRDIANNFLSQLFPEFGSWLKKDGNELKTFNDWLDETGVSTEDLKNRMDEFKRSITGVALAIGLLISPLKTIAVYIGGLAVKDDDLRNSLLLTADAIGDAMMNLGKAFADLLVLISPIVKLIAQMVSVIIQLNNFVGITPFQIMAIFTAIMAIKGLALLSKMEKGLENLKKLGKELKSLRTNIAQTGKQAINTQNQVNMKQKMLNLAIGMTTFAISYMAFSGVISLIGKQFGEEAQTVVSACAIMVGAIMALVGAIMVLRAIRTGGVSLAKDWALVGIGAGMAVAGVASLLAIKDKSFANGGYISGSAFIAGESGPEWVGRIGKTSTIMNDRQMDDIMSAAVTRGVVAGNKSSGTNNGNARPIAVYIDGKKLFDIMDDVGVRQGKKIGRA